MTGHVVSDDCDGDVVLCEFPGSQPESLEKWACLISNHCHLLACITRAADYAECCAVVASGRECAGVAVCKHCGTVGNEWSTVMTDRAIRGDVFFVDGECFRHKRFLDFFDVVQIFVSLKGPAHPLDGPEEIHGGGTRLAHHVANVEQIVFEICD